MKIMLYGLSTCGWCKKVRKLLDEKQINYDYVNVDLLEGDEREKTREAVKRHNPDCSYPTIVINNSTCIVGFDEKKIMQEIE